MAKKHRVSRSSIQTNKAMLAREIKEFMGEDILQQMAQLPAWKNNLVANRERTARKKAAKG